MHLLPAKFISMKLQTVKPQDVSLKQVGGQEQLPLIVGQTATFECVSHGSRPEATIHWLFQGIRHDTPMNGK